MMLGGSGHNRFYHNKRTSPIPEILQVTGWTGMNTDFPEKTLTRISRIHTGCSHSRQIREIRVNSLHENSAFLRRFPGAQIDSHSPTYPLTRLLFHFL